MCKDGYLHRDNGMPAYIMYQYDSMAIYMEWYDNGTRSKLSYNNL